MYDLFYYKSLAADKVFFNSQYHLDSFFEALPRFLKGFPDNNELRSIQTIKDKSEVLYLGMDLKKFDEFESVMEAPKVPLILWNHRWEYDKNPEDFFKALYILDEKELQFELVLLGENFSQQPNCFEKAKEHFGKRILHYGFAESLEDYAQWLHRANILPVTSNQDFFGGSVVEAMYCGVVPLLPNRLAFPEHIPDSKRNQYLYNDFDEFTSKLEQLIIEFSKGNTSEPREYVEKYDWRLMAPVYDSALESFLPK